ncbi:tRNA (guanosine(18)-2'-O)-methyltransferase [Marinicella pacifica]|uniref:tRNA (guanosine(18)-2'-O)-methyltransferase n=1 Tax=Marinicella pacifica TaxID=1171543 RepID=A0A917CN83_9GAMM|nr:tRNA (guanosine(18)-2'-O)-methyltransferase TrmH [Marinicella pacifica]GGF93707.1 tRNA (guanosine(18)-2'-O)-methyltransferase [Marinicella pacifica]
MTPQRFATLKKVLDQRQPDLTVVMDGVHKPHNFNAIIRTCDAVGVFEAHYIPVTERYRELTNTGKGSEKYVYAHRHNHFSEIGPVLKNQGYQLLAAHLSDEAVDFRAIDFTRPTALVMGAELEGLNPKTAQQVDQHVIIPMQGMVESLNVSVACAIMLYEAQRQRLAAGLYDNIRLDEETYRKTLFEWCWPRVAELCQEQDRDYPPLDASGEFESF